MRKSAAIFLSLSGWLAAQGCVFAHDAGCLDSSDCTSGRTCNAGECVAIDGGEGKPKGEVPLTGDGTTTTLAPECPVSELGTAPLAAQSAALVSEGASQTLLLSASGNLVTRIGGKACSLIKKPSFTSNAPCNDLYRCGGCDMLVSKLAKPPTSTISGMTQWLMGLWSPDDGTCASWDATYYLSKSASSGSTGGSNDACSSCSDACRGIPGCSCCKECGGFCFN